MDPVELVVAGLHHEVKAAHSLVVKPQCLLGDLNLEEFAALALPGGFHDRGFTEAYSPEVLQVIRTIYDNGGAIASVCVGAKPLAKAGVLKGKKATTYPFDGGVHIRYLEEHGVEIVDADVVVSERIITSSDPATAIQVAFKLLEILSGKEDSERVKEVMGFGATKSGKGGSPTNIQPP